MVVLTNTQPTSDKMPDKMEHKLIDAMHKEIEAYWMYANLAKASEDNKHVWALWEIMDDEYLHARYIRKYLIENDMYDMNSPCEEKYRDMLVDKMVHRYGWED